MIPGKATAPDAGAALRPMHPPATLGMIGLGAMGGPMARNLAAGGYRVLGFDTSAERLRASAAAGVEPERGLDTVVGRCDAVLTSLPSSEALVQVAEEHFLPRARPGQLFVDLGTVTPPETRRLAAALRERGADLVDAPVSGGPGGADARTLFMFVGGEVAAVQRAWPILAALAGDGRITHCGPSGSGQIAKGVNQLAMGLGAAAYLEAVAFGVLAGLDPAALGEAVGGDAGWRAMVAQTARRISEGKGDEIGVKFRELPYFLREAREAGFALPLTEVLYAFCDRGPRVVVDDNRPAPSFFHELVARRAGPVDQGGAPAPPPG